MITPEQFIAVMAALTAMLVALGGVYSQVRQTHQLVNSRMTQLLDVTKQGALAEGHIEGALQARTSDADLSIRTG